MILLLLASGIVSVADSSPFVGDVDGNGAVSGADAAMIMRHIISEKRLDREQSARADVNGDLTVNSVDAAYILRTLVFFEEVSAFKGSVSMIITSDLSGAVISGSGNRTATVSNVAAYVKEERKKNPDLLLMDAGGSLYGSAVADGYDAVMEYREGPIARAFSEMHYDAVLLGSEVFLQTAQVVRDDVDYMRKKGVQVLGTNLAKSNPAISDEILTTWNEVLPYAIFEVPTMEEEPIRVGVIGLSTDFSDGSQNDEITAEQFYYFASHYLEYLERGENCDCIIALMHTTIEDDEWYETREQMTARSLVEQTQGIDLVLCGYGNGYGVRSISNVLGEEVPVIALADDANTILRLDISIREDHGNIGFGYEWIDTLSFREDAELKKIMNRYAGHADAVLDTRICAITHDITPYDTSEIKHTDVMEVIHRTHVDGVQTWARENEVDLSPNVLSISYPYIGTEGIRAGTLYYRDISQISMEKPNYSLMLVRGSELKAWLRAYTDTIKTDTPVYSLYGLQYLLNTMNPDAPLPFLQDVYGVNVQEDAVFTVLVAENGEVGSLLKPYLDTEWMPYEERFLTDFAFPKPSFETIYLYSAADPLIAYLERQGTLTLEYTPNWYLW